MNRSVTLNDVKAAADRIKPFINRTPVLTSNTLNVLSGKSLFFKCENLQKVGAFKYRGASNAVLQVVKDKAPQRPILITHSSGNHAQAVALAAKMHGLKAFIVMPSNAPVIKKNAVKDYGATVVECEPNQTARERTAAELQEKYAPDSYYISPYDHPHIIAGQGTSALELLHDYPNLDAVIAPVGGGGLLSGVCIAVKGVKPSIEVFAAEPLNADDCAKSFAAKERIPLSAPPQTIADGLRVSVGNMTWPIIKDNITDVITVTETEIIATTKLVFERMKIVIEPSAAVCVAAVLTPKFKTMYNYHKNVGVILSGGNVDLNKLPWLFSPSSNL